VGGPPAPVGATSGPGRSACGERSRAVRVSVTDRTARCEISSQFPQSKTRNFDKVRPEIHRLC
jgi:hypothetical protein